MTPIKVKLDRATEENWRKTRGEILAWIDRGLKELPAPKTVNEIETMAKAGCFLLRILGDATPIKDGMDIPETLGELRARMAKDAKDGDQVDIDNISARGPK